MSFATVDWMCACAFSVAATGLPETRNDHAELMARFAHECRYTINKVVKHLEVSLGYVHGAGIDDIVTSSRFEI